MWALYLRGQSTVSDPQEDFYRQKNEQSEKTQQHKHTLGVWQPLPEWVKYFIQIRQEIKMLNDIFFSSFIMWVNENVSQECTS